ncbi:heavy metal-binding protein HIP-like [Dreissena polymorpha]|uniref:C1q domain-containing protein n=1 Tax=Dreissena polymorpha TaxID=45954 RepID=A0A9D4HKM0_DREPO|nr:heavy metal-binding protein HIP-like [Dreissena polymorpha]KAH3721009.1 hypothetical protein DPMN_063921 [Dreissena polymorpha]
MAKYEPDEVEYSCSDQRDVLIENLPKSFMALVDKLTEQETKIKELTKRQDQVIVDNTPLIDLKKSELIKEVDYLRSMVSTLERRVTLLEEKQQAGPGAVAFFATVSDDIGHLHDRQRILFDNVLTNTGDAYNEHNGTFVAPVAGLYVFSTTLMSSKG